MDASFDVVDYNFYSSLDLNTCISLGLQDNSRSNNANQGLLTQLLDINTQTLLNVTELPGGLSLSDLLEDKENISVEPLPRNSTATLENKDIPFEALPSRSILEDKNNIPVEPLPSSSSTPATDNKVNAARFAAPLMPKDVEKKKGSTVPRNTSQSNSWESTLWRDWVRNRNQQPATTFEPGFPIPEDIALFSDLNDMDYWLQRFICEIRRRDGKPYPPDTLTQITAAIQRCLRNDKHIHVNFFSKEDKTFPGFRQALDSRMRELTNQGIGIEKKQAEPVTPSDERKMWETGVFSMDNATGLSNLVFYNNGKVFGLRGGEEHIGLQADQFSFGIDEFNQRQFIKFTPRIRKNAQGGLKQSKKVTSVMTPIKHYEQSENKIAVFKIYQTYLDLIHRIGNFYRKPLDGFRFSAGTISQKGMMKRFFHEAGISMENRNISNHSGRVTLCSILYNQHFSDKAVMSRSKHVSNAVRNYQREDFNMIDNMCQSLEPELPNFKQDVKPDSHCKFPEIGKDETKTVEQEPKPIYSKIKDKNNNTVMYDENNILTMTIPKCIKKLVIVKSDGKRFVMDV